MYILCLASAAERRSGLPAFDQSTGSTSVEASGSTELASASIEGVALAMTLEFLTRLGRLPEGESPSVGATLEDRPRFPGAVGGSLSATSFRSSVSDLSASHATDSLWLEVSKTSICSSMFDVEIISWLMIVAPGEFLAFRSSWRHSFSSRTHTFVT